MIEEFVQSLREFLRYRVLFESGGPLSRRVSINYGAVSSNPWICFNHPSDEDLSFRIHNLEFGEERQGEAMLLHTSVQKGKQVVFNGFVSRLHFLGKNKMRGYIEIPSDYYRLGVVVNDGRVTEMITTGEMTERCSKLILPFIFSQLNGKTLADKI